MKIPIITFWDRLKLLFVKRQQDWDFETQLLTIYKERKGIVYIITQEPIAYGDMRNHQIGRWE